MDHQTTLRNLYQNFNNRQIDVVFAFLHTGVNWPNGWEGGNVHGHDELRAYWLRQWHEIDPTVTPVSFHVRKDGRIAVVVHQFIKDLHGEILSDSQVTHIYTFELGKITKMEIEKM
jgi:hypothetical protein